MYNSLRWKVILPLIIITIISSALVNSVWKSWYISDVEQLLEDKWIAQLSYATQIDDQDTFYEYLNFMSRTEDSYSESQSNSQLQKTISVYNQEFERTWSNHVESAAMSQYEDYLQISSQKLANTSSSPYFIFKDNEQQERNTVIVYMLSQFNENHFIVIDIPIIELIDNHLLYKVPVVYTFIVFLALVGLMIGLYIWKDIFLPIDRITTVVKRVARGQFDHQIFVNRKDEFDTLAKSVNQMIQSSREKVNELSDEKSKLEGVLNNMLSGVILISHSGHIEYVNPSAEKILAIHKDQLITQKYKQSLKEYGINKHISNALKQGEVFRNQSTIRKGAMERIVEVSIIPIKNINRLITSVIVVIHDISDIKRLEQIRAEFVANVSHEIKTPITSIKGFAETIIDGAIDDRQTLLDFTTIIYKESIRLSNLVQDLLDLSKIESSHAAIEKNEEDLVEIANEVIGNLKNELDKHDVAISLYSNRNHSFHYANRDRIKQVFINLISNAISYSKDQSTVFVRVFDNERDIVIEVEDNGIGIPERDLPRIFERFYRVHKDRSRATGGTGLGLSIVKHIVDVHQGSIEVVSKVGVGTTFRITFPKDLNG